MDRLGRDRDDEVVKLTSPCGFMQAPQEDVNEQHHSQQVLRDGVGCCGPTAGNKKGDFRGRAKVETVERRQSADSVWCSGMLVFLASCFLWSDNQ